MRKARVAEWILSQVLPPDRAASTVGDWIEDAAERGNIWFWSCVFRTVLWRIWNDLAEAPNFMLSLALRSCLFSWLIYVIGVIVLIPAMAVFRFPGELAGWAFGTACGVLTGRWTARRAIGRKMAACIICGLMNLILSGAISLGSIRFLSSDIKYSLKSHAANTPWIVAELIFEIGLIVGFLWLRRPKRSVAQ